MIVAMTNAPDGYRTVTPRIAVTDVRGQIAFLRQVFDAVGEELDGRPTELTIGDSMVMIGSTVERQTHNAFLYIYVDDVDDRYRRAMTLGASSIEAPFDTPYGDRRAMVGDPFGNTYQLAKRTTDPA